MSYRVVQELPSAEEVAERFPVGPEHRVEEHRQTIRNILSGSDRRLFMAVGPCSASPKPAVERYGDRLARLAEDVRDRLFTVMRLFIQKPRSTVGWPGPLTQPDPLAPPDIRRGIWECSEMMWSVGKKLPLMDEMLYTSNESYFKRWLALVSVGARSSTDQEHRYIASGLLEEDGDMPVGVKNTPDGNTLLGIELGVDGVQCAQQPHTFAWRRQAVETTGNPFAHLILRGGFSGSNYDPASIAHARSHLVDPKRSIQNPAIVIDASHDNSRNGKGKDPRLQMHVVDAVMRAKMRGIEGYNLVRGFMAESFLLHGNQKIGPEMNMDGLSITDPCLSWDDTERMIRETADQVDRLLGRAS